MYTYALNRSVSKNKRKKSQNLSFIVSIVFILFLISNPVSSACLPPVSAQLCAAIDDTAYIYLNNVLLDTFTYCDVSWACTPKCINLSPAQLALLTETGNLLSVRTDNSDAQEMWASWSLDITCAGGEHSYVSSAEAGISMYHRSDPTCPGIELPDDSYGTHWYDPAWITATAGTWVTPIIEEGFKYGRRIYDPATGSLLPAMSYSADSSVGVDCQQLFFRQPFDLTIEPTPEPPSFTISKSSAKTGVTGPSVLTFTITVCNTGGGTKGEPVSILDDWTSTTDDWQWQGSWDYTDNIVGFIDQEDAGTRLRTITFQDGFPADYCYDYQVRLQSYNPVAQCITWYNKATLRYPDTTPIATASVQISNFCPSPTPTAGPADLTISKSAATTSGIAGNQVLTFTLQVCNNGDYIPPGATFTIFDDWSSSGTNWSYQGPYPPKDHLNQDIVYSTSGETATFNFVNGFPGGGFCHSFWFRIQSWSAEPACFTWHNDAFLSYQASPTRVSTVTLVNVLDASCATRTITPTITVTRTITPTRTMTITPTSTVPPMDIQLTKTIDRNIVMLGETVTYCLNYRNNGTGPSSFTIWDTIPAVTDFISCWGTPATCYTTTIGGNNIVYWTISNLAAGASGQVCFNVAANRLPYFMPFEHNLFAVYDRYMMFALARGGTAAREGP